MKSKVLVLLKHYVPGYKSGGPIRTIENMVETLGDEFEFWIVTSDRDAQATEPYENVEIDEWNQIGEARVFYASRRSLSFRRLQSLIRIVPHDVLYINSFFSPNFSLKPLVFRALGVIPKRPILVAPRGEFSRGAIALKAWKKIPFIALTKLSRIHKNVIWQASSNYEGQDIQRVMRVESKSIHVAPDIPSKMDLSTRKKTGRNYPLQVVFLSRVTAKKNLDVAIEILDQVRCRIGFAIYGPIADKAYWNRCLKRIRALPPHIDVRYRGEVVPDRVVDVLADYDLFFLPTLGENYGHVIGEALSAGTPVLISNTTPWRELEHAGVGWDLPIGDPKEFVEKIHVCANKTNEEYCLWRQEVRRKAVEWLQDSDIVQSNRHLMRMICGIR